MKRTSMLPWPKHRSGWIATVGILCIGAMGYRDGWSALRSPSMQVGQQAISVSTDVVRVPVMVTDERGNFIAGLSVQNFLVYEDKRPQHITFYEQQDVPITVGLLVDHSGSMAGKLPEVAEAISALAHSSNPQDEMFVVDFGDEVLLEKVNGKPFSSDPAELGRAVAKVSAQGRTALYDAVVAGFDHLRLGQWQKKALIIVSDGGDNASHHNYAEVLALARSSQVVIYAIGLVGEPGEEENPKVLERICKDTGGIAFFPQMGESIVEVANRISTDLRKQYTLGYIPDRDRSGDTYRRIEVRVSVPGQAKIRVRSRTGYTITK